MSTISLSSVTDFYQKHESKLVLLVMVVLAIYLLAFAAELTWKLVPQPESNSPNNTISSTANQINQTNSSNTNISNVLALNLFGDAQAEPAVEQVSEITDVPETSLNLLLSGVVASSDPEKGAAVIAYRSSQGTYGVGDKIEGTNAVLDEIYVDRVIIKNRLARETLMLEGIDFEEANRNRAQQQRQVQEQTARSPKQTLSNAEASAVNEARQQLSDSPQNFTDFISLRPHIENRQIVGYRVAPGKNPSLFNTLGLVNGDIIVTLNGLDLSDQTQAQEALAQLQQAETLQLDILRAGEYVSLELDMNSDS